MYIFAGMVHNESTTLNIDQIANGLDVMSILLSLNLKAFTFFYKAKVCYLVEDNSLVTAQVFILHTCLSCLKNSSMGYS